MCRCRQTNTIDGGQNAPEGNIQIVFHRFLPCCFRCVRIGRYASVWRRCFHSTSINTNEFTARPKRRYIFHLIFKLNFFDARTNKRKNAEELFAIRTARDDVHAANAMCQSLSTAPPRPRPCIGAIIICVRQVREIYRFFLRRPTAGCRQKQCGKNL